ILRVFISIVSSIRIDGSSQYKDPHIGSGRTDLLYRPKLDDGSVRSSCLVFGRASNDGDVNYATLERSEHIRRGRSITRRLDIGQNASECMFKLSQGPLQGLITLSRIVVIDEGLTFVLEPPRKSMVRQRDFSTDETTVIQGES